MVACTSRLVLGLFLCLGCFETANAGCSQQDAVDKMMAVSQGLEKLQADNAIDTDRLLAANEKLNQGGGALGGGNYDEACQIYDEIAKDNGITMP